LWPSHAHVAVAEGDLVFVEGKFTRAKGESKDGTTPVTYNNLSVSDFINLGSADGGKDEREAASNAAVEDDDDIPF
jgi:single-stranded DNA-binding protein